MSQVRYISSNRIYKSSNLLIANGCTIVLSAISVFIGAYAFYIKRFSNDTKATAFVMAIRRPEVIN